MTRAGTVKEITALSNPVIKYLKSLNLKKNRQAERVFLAEGLKLITDAVEQGWVVKTLVYCPKALTNTDHQAHLQRIAATARAKGADILEVSAKVLSAITRRENPQMVVGLMEQRWLDLSSVSAIEGETWIALDRVRDPGNLGTIIRTADAVGASGLILVGDTTDPWSIEAVRATMGSIFNIPLVRASEEQFLHWRTSWQGTVIGTHLKGAIDYRHIDYDAAPVLLLMGNEQQGLPDKLADSCNTLALIPQAGRADSLNLAVATGIMLFEVRRSFLQVPDQKRVGSNL